MTQIIVLGTHRSGASLVTRLINLMGASFDAGASEMGKNDLAESAIEKGFWERRDVVEINDEILNHFDCTWNQLAGWDLDKKVTTRLPKPLKALQDQAKPIVESLDKSNKCWTLKDPRFCLTLPYWKKLFTKPVYVLVTRDGIETAASMKLRHNLSISQGLALWEYYMTAAHNALRGETVIIVNHRDLLKDAEKECTRILKELQSHDCEGLKAAPKKQILDFIKQEMYRSKREDYSADEILTPHHQSLQKTLAKEPTGKENLSISRLSLDAMERRKAEQVREEHFAELNTRAAEALQSEHKRSSELEDKQSEVAQLNEVINALKTEMKSEKDTYIREHRSLFRKMADVFKSDSQAA